MASRRYSFVFFIAVVVAIGATYAVFKVLESTKASNRVATASVVVANRDISQGEMIDRLALSVAQWPVATVPVGAYGRIDSVAGRVARVAVFTGEPLVPGRLAPEGTNAGLMTKITPGKRAMAIRINDVTGIAGMIPVDSRVDIGLVTTVGSSKTAKIFMENMRVLMMATEALRSEDGRPIPATVATLEVTPEETEKLMVAQSQGTIQLFLRGYGDPDSVKTKGATSAELERSLRNAPSAPAPTQRRATPQQQVTRAAPETVIVRDPVRTAPPVVKPDTAKVEVFRGAKKEELKFGKDSVRRDTIPNN